MTKYKKIINQTISSTHTDTQGEKQTKGFLEKLCKYSGKRLPLNQQHDMRKETIGYIENYRVVPDENHPGEWLLKGEVYYTCENIDDAMKGFSYSFTEPLVDTELGREFQIYLPFPHYNDATIIEYLNKEKLFTIGRWYKKAGDPETISIIVSGILFVLSPLWNQTFNDHVSPAIKKLLGRIKPLWDKGLHFDLIQIIQDNNKNEIELYFIPDRASKDESLEPDFIKEGISEAEKYLCNNPNDAEKGIKMIKLYFDIQKKKYCVFHVQFLDGNDINIIE